MVAKFKCTEVARTEGGGIRIQMVPVVSGSPENERFFRLTPYGKLEIGTINPSVEKHFEPGKMYFIDITEAPDVKEEPKPESTPEQPEEPKPEKPKKEKS